METNQNSIGHETEDASVVSIVRAGAGLAVIVVLSGLIVYAVFQFLVSHPVSTGPANPMAETVREFPPQPRIEDHPAAELNALHAQEERLLSTYGWTDKKAGVVRIPIDRAMRLQMERGFPARKEGAK
jgi:hypothetical protein